MPRDDGIGASAEYDDTPLIAAENETRLRSDRGSIRSGFKYTKVGYEVLADVIARLLAVRFPAAPAGSEPEIADIPIGMPDPAAFDAAVEPIWRALRGGDVAGFHFDIHNNPSAIPPGRWDEAGFFRDACFRTAYAKSRTSGESDFTAVFVETSVFDIVIDQSDNEILPAQDLNDHHSPFLRLLLVAADNLELTENEILSAEDMQWWICEHSDRIEPGLNLSNTDIKSMVRLLRWPSQAGKRQSVSRERLNALGINRPRAWALPTRKP